MPEITVDTYILRFLEILATGAVTWFAKTLRDRIVGFFETVEKLDTTVEGLAKRVEALEKGASG